MILDTHQAAPSWPKGKPLANVEATDLQGLAETHLRAQHIRQQLAAGALCANHVGNRTSSARMPLQELSCRPTSHCSPCKAQPSGHQELSTLFCVPVIVMLEHGEKPRCAKDRHAARLELIVA